MKKNTVLTILFAVIALTAIAGIFYRNYDTPGRRHMGHHMKRPPFHNKGPMMEGNFIGRHFCRPGFMKDELKLSETQIEKINSLNSKYDAEHRRLRKELEPERNRMRELLSSKDPDIKEIRKVLMKNSGKHVELRIMRIRQGKEINSILTPEQLEILRERRDETFRKRGRHFWRER